MDNDRDIKFDIVIGHHWSNSAFSKWLPKHGIKMGVQIQHCPISSKFDMWVDSVSGRSPFSKWPPQYHTNSTSSDFNDISYVGRL